MVNKYYDFVCLVVYSHAQEFFVALKTLSSSQRGEIAVINVPQIYECSDILECLVAVGFMHMSVFCW
jgi:hypothetical protein